MPVHKRFKHITSSIPHEAFDMSEEQIAERFAAIRQSNDYQVHPAVRKHYQSYVTSRQGSGTVSNTPTDFRVGDVPLNGDIITDDIRWMYEFFEEPHTSPSMVRQYLDAADGKDLRLVVSSIGGIVMGGAEIRSMLRDYREANDAKIQADIRFAASMALDTALMADDRYMDVFGTIAPHQTVVGKKGRAEDFAHLSAHLRSTDETLARDTERATGQKEGTFLPLLREQPNGLWIMNSDEAKKYGFVHRVLGSRDNVNSGANTSRNSINRNQETRMTDVQRKVASVSEENIEGTKYRRIEFDNGDVKYVDIETKQEKKDDTNGSTGEQVTKNATEGTGDKPERKETDDSGDKGQKRSDADSSNTKDVTESEESKVLSLSERVAQKRKDKKRSFAEFAERLNKMTS